MPSVAEEIKNQVGHTNLTINTLFFLAEKTPKYADEINAIAEKLSLLNARLNETWRVMYHDRDGAQLSFEEEEKKAARLAVIDKLTHTGNHKDE